jgi:hypothetical protein
LSIFMVNRKRSNNREPVRPFESDSPEYEALFRAVVDPRGEAKRVVAMEAELERLRALVGERQAVESPTGWPTSQAAYVSQFLAGVTAEVVELDTLPPDVQQPPAVPPESRDDRFMVE